MKLDPQLDAPIFATLYGPQNGSTYSSAPATVPSWLTVDNAGNVYAAGWTGLVNWPTGTFQSGQEGYLLKISDIPANPGVLLTSDHLYFPMPYTDAYWQATANNFGISVSQFVTIVNHSGSSLQINSIAGDGTKTDPLSGSQNCIGTLAVDAACTITVTFAPQKPGDLSGTVTITDSSSTSPHVITGIGTGFMGQGTPASTSLTFASTAVGQSSASQTLLLNNTGNLGLYVSSVTATGDFSETNNCSGGLTVGTACAIYVTFKPTQGGNRTGTLSISDDGPGNPHIISLSGTGSGPAASFSPSTLTFAFQAVNTTSAAQAVTLANSGTASLSITSIAATGDFAETHTCGTSVAAAGNCTISVTFKPTASGTSTGTLTITDNVVSSPQTVALTGTGTSTPTATLSPTSLTFASQNTGSTSVPQVVTLTNSGQATLSITSISASGDFAETNNCGTSVTGGGNCSISVTFKPTAAGTRTGALTITDNATGSPQTVSLSGTGTTAVPTVSLSPTSVTFASQSLGSTSAPQTVTLTNSGQATLSITSIAASGDFAVTNNCSTTVAAGANCSVSITFQPTAAGTRTGTLTITDNATGSPQTVSLSGTGTSQVAMSTLAPTSLTFASQAVGSTSSAQTVTLTNSGQATLSITSIAASGDFAETNNCATSVAAGANCTITVTFTPTAAGTRTGTLTVTDNASGSPHTVGLSGTGTGTTTVPIASLSPTSLTFSSQTKGSTSAPQTVILTNSGQAALNISSIAASGDFAETNTCGSSVAPVANCTVSVTFTPTADGTRSGTLTVTDNAAGSPHTVSLSGTGSDLSVSTTTSALTIGSPGGSGTANIQISTAGGFSGTVNFTCSVQFQGAGTPNDPPTCSLSPTQGQVAAGSPASTTLSVATTAGSVASLREFWLPSGTVMAAILVWGFLPRRRWRGLGLLLILCIAPALSMVGCGGSSNPPVPPPTPGTTAGSYTVTITATSGSISVSKSLSLTVQ